jgi:hypothetical protein
VPVRPLACCCCRHTPLLCLPRWGSACSQDRHGCEESCTAQLSTAAATAKHSVWCSLQRPCNSGVLTHPCPHRSGAGWLVHVAPNFDCNDLELPSCTIMNSTAYSSSCLCCTAP